MGKNDIELLKGFLKEAAGEAARGADESPQTQAPRRRAVQFPEAKVRDYRTKRLYFKFI